MDGHLMAAVLGGIILVMGIGVPLLNRGKKSTPAMKLRAGAMNRQAS